MGHKTHVRENPNQGHHRTLKINSGITELIVRATFPKVLTLLHAEMSLSPNATQTQRLSHERNTNADAIADANAMQTQ